MGLIRDADGENAFLLLSQVSNSLMAVW